MSSLPNQVNFSTPAGSQWAQTFRMPDTDITGLTWQFTIRTHATDTGQPALVEVTTTVGAQGWITVDTVARTVQVVLAAAATAALGKGARPYVLWANPGTGQDTAWVEGIFNTQLVAIP